MWLFRVAEHLHLDLRVGPQVKASLENLQIKSTKVPLVLASSAGMSCASLLGLIQGRKTWDQVLITALVGVVVGLIIAYASPQTSFSESGIHRTMWWGLKKKFVAWSAIKAVSEPRANVEMNISIWTDKEGFNIADLDGIGKLWRDVLQTHLDSDTLCLTRMHAIPVESQATAPFSTE